MKQNQVPLRPHASGRPDIEWMLWTADLLEWVQVFGERADSDTRMACSDYLNVARVELNQHLSASQAVLSALGVIVRHTGCSVGDMLARSRNFLRADLYAGPTAQPAPPPQLWANTVAGMDYAIQELREHAKLPLVDRAALLAKESRIGQDLTDNEAGPQNWTNEHVLSKEDWIVLRELGSSPCALKAIEIAGRFNAASAPHGAPTDRTVIGAAMNRLKDAGYVEYPHGPRKGAAVTKAGQELLDKYPQH